MNAKEYKELTRLQDEAFAIVKRRVEQLREVNSKWCNRAFHDAFGTKDSNKLKELCDTLVIPYTEIVNIPAFGMEIFSVETTEKHEDYTLDRTIHLPAYAMVMSEEEWADVLNKKAEEEYNKFIKSIEGEFKVC